jgi:hypothetical protein
MAIPVLVNGMTGVSNTPIQVRAGICKIKDIVVYNASAAVAFLSFYDSVLAPTVGTTVPVWQIGMNTLVSVPIAIQDEAGLVFNLGCWVAATTTAGGSSAPATALPVSLGMA